MANITKIVLISFLLIFVAGIQSAHALAKLRLSDGTTIIDVYDGEVGKDTNANIGAITYTDYNVLNFTYLNVSTGISYGTNTEPWLHLHVDYTTTTDKSEDEEAPELGGSTVVSFTETGFGPLDSSIFRMWTGGDTEGTVALNAYVDNSNAEFGMGTLAGSLGPYSTPTFNDSTYKAVSVVTPFSMTVVATVDHSGDGQSGFDLDVAIVPEPVSSLLFLAGGAALGLRRFRRKV